MRGEWLPGCARARRSDGARGGAGGQGGPRRRRRRRGLAAGWRLGTPLLLAHRPGERPRLTVATASTVRSEPQAPVSQKVSRMGLGVIP